jgi:hypothetical protein
MHHDHLFIYANFFGVPVENDDDSSSHGKHLAFCPCE